MFGKVIVDDEHIPALVHKVFRNGHPGIRGNILHRGRLAGGGVQDDAVLHGPML